MLKKVVITNCFDESMEYAIDGVQAENPSGLIITSIDGLGPVKANINMMDLATTDGQLYNSARLSGRNIVIKAVFTHASSIEEARLLSYKYFPIKKKLKFHIETDERIGEIEGYVESNEPDIFSKQSGCQISILCENPYFDGGEVDYNFNNGVIPLFKFKFGNDESEGERVIKMSEYAESNRNRELNYTGDADTGAKLNFNFLTGDIMDTFKATKIEIYRDGDKLMGFDLSKMSSLVPNTMPDNVTGDNVYFAYRSSDNKYKCLGETPESISNAHAVVYKGYVHVIFGHRHYRYNNKDWVFIGDLPYDMGAGGSCVVYNDEIHILGGINAPYHHFKWNETGDWQYVSNLPYGADRYGFAVVCGDKIHLLGGSSSVADGRLHYSWNGNYWAEEISLPVAFDDGFPIVYNNTIYLFPQSFGRDYFSIQDGGSSWTSHSANKRPGYAFYNNAPHVVYDGKIHIFGDPNKHCVYDPTTDSFSEMSDAPLKTYCVCGCVVDDLVYLFGGYDDSSNTYTEEANNIKLIENDQLIVNTIKGQKSITLIRGENEYKVLNVLEKNPTWFELKRGINRFTYTAAGGSENALKLTITANKLYEGV